MNTFDVRSPSAEPTVILFAEEDSFDYSANELVRYANGIKIKDSESSQTLVIKNREHVENLRKALDKAEELGWFK